MIHDKSALNRRDELNEYNNRHGSELLRATRGKESAHAKRTETSAAIITCPVVSKSISSTRSFPSVTDAVNNNDNQQHHTSV